MTFDLHPKTEAGRRFVAAAHELTPELRETAAIADRDSTMSAETFRKLQDTGIAAACVPEALGGWGLSSVYDWMLGIRALAQGDGAAAIAINLLRGRSHIDCGCGDTPVLLSYWLVLRNALLAGGAAVLLLPATGDAALLSWLAILPGALVLILCYVAMAQLLDNASSLREWRTGS